MNRLEAREIFSRNVRNRMRLKNWRASEVARRLGIMRQAVSSHISPHRKTMPTARTVEMYAQVFKCSPNELLPDYEMACVGAEIEPEIQMTPVQDGNVGDVMLRLHKCMPLSHALRVMAVVDEANQAMNRRE